MPLRGQLQPRAHLKGEREKDKLGDLPPNWGESRREGQGKHITDWMRESLGMFTKQTADQEELDFKLPDRVCWSLDTDGSSFIREAE